MSPASHSPPGRRTTVVDRKPFSNRVFMPNQIIAPGVADDTGLRQSRAYSSQVDKLLEDRMADAPLYALTG